MSFAAAVGRIIRKDEKAPPQMLSATNAHLVADSFIGKADEDWGDRSDIWHPSMLAKGPTCPRLEMMRRQRPDMFSRKGYEASLELTFKIGTALHAMYQNEIWGRQGVLWGRWLDMESLHLPKEAWVYHWGFMPSDEWLLPGAVRKWVYVELAVFNKELMIGGHIDAIICPDKNPDTGYLVDLKTSMSEPFGFTQEVRKAHKAQAQFYRMLDPQVPEGVTPPKILGFGVWYLNKDTNEQKLFFVEDGLTDETRASLELVKTVNAAEAEESLPKRHRACKGPTQSKPKACPLKEICFDIEDGKTGLIQLRSR